MEAQPHEAGLGSPGQKTGRHLTSLKLKKELSPSKFPKDNIILDIIKLP